LNEWQATYGPHGLTIIGVQGRGDYSAEKVEDFGIEYAAANDPEMQTWDAYGMRTQPSWAFIGPQGDLIQRQVGVVTTDTVLGLIEQYTSV
jgi:hypothetical protein